MAMVHKTLLALVAAVLVLTSCTNCSLSEPDEVQTTEVVDDHATEPPLETSVTVEQESLRPPSSRRSPTLFPDRGLTKNEIRFGDVIPW